MKQSLIICLSASLLFVGCQHIQKAPNITTQTVNASNQFKITGKIGVRTPTQNGSAFYGWTQADDHFAIDLIGALGIGQTSIRGIPNHVELTSSKTGTITAETPEELLFTATGWQAPITYLISWVDAKPASKSAQITQDSLNRLNTIQEGGWSATLSYKNQETLPNKLVLIDDNQENRVTLTIQSRE